MFSNLLDITGFFVSVLINLLLIALICYYFKRKIDNLEFSQSEQAKTLYALLSQQNSMPSDNIGESKNVVMSVNDVMGGLDLTQLTQGGHNEHEHDESNLNIGDGSSDGSESESESEEDENEEDVNEEDVNEEDESEPAQVVLEEVKMEETQQDDFVSDNTLVTDIDESDVIKVDTSFHVNEVDEMVTGEEDVATEETVMENVETNIETNTENYGKMTIKELRSVLAEKGIHAKSSMNKGDIINILKGTTSMSIEEDNLET